MPEAIIVGQLATTSAPYICRSLPWGDVEGLPSSRLLGGRGLQDWPLLSLFSLMLLFSALIPF